MEENKKEEFTEAMQEELINGLTVDEMQLFVGNKSEYYIDKWRSSKNPYKNSGWNAAPIFGGLLWLGYRKMYLTLLKFIGIFIIFDIVQILLNINIDRVIELAVTGFLGFKGNSMYFNHMCKKIENINTANYNPDRRREEIEIAGGGSWKGFGISILIIIAYFIFLTLMYSFVG